MFYSLLFLFYPVKQPAETNQIAAMDSAPLDALNISKLEKPPQISCQSSSTSDSQCTKNTKFVQRLQTLFKTFRKYLGFVGPGLMVSVAYMDPGNYSTSVAAGASNRYSLLFVVLFSNIIAIFYQSLCVKLGTVTGLDLSRSCRKHLPWYLNWTVYCFAECAIIATDIAEVIGTAIALNILIKVPLPAGVCITLIDVLIVMMAYQPGANLKFVKMFEMIVATLVFIVIICFCVQLSYLKNVDVRTLFRGWIPSHEMIEGQGIYIAVSVIGATVMPHSLFLGSALVQPRLRDYDLKQKRKLMLQKQLIADSDDEAQEVDVIAVSNSEKKQQSDSYDVEVSENSDEAYYSYVPSFGAIKYAYKYSVVEVALTLFTFALFVNSSILIIAGSSLYGSAEAADADLYSIHDLLSQTIAPAVGTIFMCALLASGQSAGIVCTMAGQIICEGHMNWKMKPWIRRLVTRGIAIIPSLIVCLVIGKEGLSKALNASQVVLSILLPFLVLPLLYFTSNTKFMLVEITEEEYEEEIKYQLRKVNKKRNFLIKWYKKLTFSDVDHSLIKDENNSRYYKCMVNDWPVIILCGLFWLLIAIMNVYAIYSAAKNGI